MTDKQIICKCNDKECGQCSFEEQLKRKEQELNDYKIQFEADTKEMEEYQNEIVRHLESIEYWQHQAEAKEQECEELKTDKIFLEAHINDLTSPVNVEDCEHSVHNGEYIACSYYGGCRCDDLDFANCMFRENARLKEQLDQLKAENEGLKFQNKRLDEVATHWHKSIFKVERNERKLKQTLAEIKEIAEAHKKDESVWNPYRQLDKILQKISEVEDGN